MMDENSDARSQQLNRIIADYLNAIELGSAPDRGQLFQQHPDLADDVKSFFADDDRMRAAKAGIEAPTLPPGQAESEAATIPPGGISRESPTRPPRQRNWSNRSRRLFNTRMRKG